MYSYRYPSVYWHLLSSEDVEDDDCDDGGGYESMFLLPLSGVGVWASFRGGASDGSLTRLRRGWEQKGADEPPHGQQGEEQRAQHSPDAACWGADCVATAFCLLKRWKGSVNTMDLLFHDKKIIDCWDLDLVKILWLRKASMSKSSVE